MKLATVGLVLGLLSSVANANPHHHHYHEDDDDHHHDHDEVKEIACDTIEASYDRCLEINLHGEEKFAGLTYLHGNEEVSEGFLLNADGTKNDESHVSCTLHDDGNAEVMIHCPHDEELHSLVCNLSSGKCEEHVDPPAPRGDMVIMDEGED